MKVFLGFLTVFLRTFNGCLRNLAFPYQERFWLLDVGSFKHMFLSKLAGKIAEASLLQTDGSPDDFFVPRSPSEVVCASSCSLVPLAPVGAASMRLKTSGLGLSAERK